MDYRVGTGTLLKEILRETFELDSRLSRTIVPFLFKPGTLTREYNAGRRAKYTPPVRLYIFASLICFLLLGIRSQMMLAEAGPMSPQSIEAELRHAEQKRGEAEAEIADRLREHGVPQSDIDELQQLDEMWQKRAPASAPEAVDREALPPWAIEISSPEGLSDTPLGAAIEQRLEEFDRLPIKRQLELTISGALSYMPSAMFFLLPLYAGLLKLAFLSRRVFFVEHLVFALHLHAFVFLLVAITALIPVASLQSFVVLAIPIYSVVALKRAYGVGWLGTLGRAIFVGVSYSVFVGIGAFVVLMAAVVLQ